MDTLFIPFGTREDNGQLIEMAARWQAAYATHATNAVNEAWGTQCENKIYSPGVPVLDGVASTDTLYVLAHGQGTNLVINRPAPEGYVLDAGALALRIKLSALPSRHQRIVLSICNTNATLSQFAKSF